MVQPVSLSAYLRSWAGDEERLAVARAIEALGQAGRLISRRIAKGAIEQPMGGLVGENADGDAQKALDVWTNQVLIETLSQAGVRAIASEEEETPVETDPNGKVLVAFDPLDGSSNIDTNASVGTIFSILPATDGRHFGLLQPGSKQLAAGYVIYGPQTSLMLTLGDGAMGFTLDPDSGEFILTHPRLSILAASHEYAINASNHRHWPPALRAYVEDHLAGMAGPRGTDSNMRWIGSLVADCQRILVRGGVFLYPGDARAKYAQGRLRLLYEANPIAFLVEQAGGRATDGVNRILDLVPTEPHQRCPLVFGSREEVDHIQSRMTAELEHS